MCHQNKIWPLPFHTAPGAALAPWRYRGAGLKRSMALPWQVLGILGKKYELRSISSTALPSALSRRASAMAPARRHARKGNLVQNFRVFKPYLYIHLGLRANWDRRYKIHVLGRNLISMGDLDVFEVWCSYYGSISNYLELKPYVRLFYTL